VSELSVAEVEPTHPEEQQVELESFTRLELCDQCGVAQSFYRVEFESGFLFLCRHHFMENEAKIFETAIDVVDESDLL
jgi:ribosomal protein S14